MAMNELERIKDVLNEKKEYLFRISYATQNTFKEVVFEPKGTTIKRFNEVIEKVQKYNPSYIYVQLFAPTPKGNPSKNAIDEAKIYMQSQNNTGLGGIELYGGLNGYIEQKTTLSVLQAERQGMVEKNKELQEELTFTKRENKENQIAIKQLEDKIRDLKNEILDMDRKSKIEVEEINRKNGSLDKILTIGGTVLANKLGLDSEQLAGILGIEMPKQQQVTDKIEMIEKSKVSVSFDDENLSEQKKHAKNIAEQLNETLLKIIDANDDDNAIDVISKIAKIYNYCVKSVDNLNTVYQLTN